MHDGPGGADEKTAAYRSETTPPHVAVLDQLADWFKPAGPAQVARIELHYDVATGDWVSAYTTLKTTRRMLEPSPE